MKNVASSAALQKSFCTGLSTDKSKSQSKADKIYLLTAIKSLAVRT